MCGIFNVCVCVCVGILIICVLVFTVFCINVLCFFYCFVHILSVLM